VPLRGHRLLSTVYRLLPWFCLALLFYIPGVYLEFPADPWEHYRRLNEWSWLQTVCEHSYWSKSSYFLAYSFIGYIASPLLQLKWLDVYNTACCLLLCWQYYRLARATGLGERASFIFALLNALTFGNNIFGFYRYYGMSSSLFAQLGAVALTRLAVAAARGSMKEKLTQHGTQPFSSLPPAPFSLLLQGASVLALLALVAFNHIQGLGIAGLGISAVVVWRLIEWRRSMVWWLALAAFGLSAATILWYPRQPALDGVYRPQGWLTHWYGFNLFQPSSPAFDRAMAIIGLSGLANFTAGLNLLRRNHVVAWLTLMPIIALSLPFIAIPFTNILTSRDVGEILLYHRMLFAIPTGLALVALGAHWLQTSSFVAGDLLPCTVHLSAVYEGLRTLRLPPSVPFARLLASCPLLMFALSAIILTPASNPSFNRIYNTLMRVPADLNMQHLPERIKNIDSKSINLGAPPVFIATTGISFVIQSTGALNVLIPWRSMFVAPTSKTTLAQDYLASSVRDKKPAVFLPQNAYELYTPLSHSAYLSRHWEPHEVAFEHSGGPEAEEMALKLGYHKMAVDHFTYYFYTPQ